jgi:hypothetical protein
MTRDTEDLVIHILKDLQTRMGRMEEQMTNIELRMTAQEQHLGALLVSLPVSQDRLDLLTRRVERIERRLDLADAPR